MNLPHIQPVTHTVYEVTHFILSIKHPTLEMPRHVDPLLVLCSKAVQTNETLSSCHSRLRTTTRLCVCVCHCIYYAFACMYAFEKCTSQREKTEEAERERLTERVRLGGPEHRWLWEADVPAELFGVVPANSEMVTEVRRANRLPQDGW